MNGEINGCLCPIAWYRKVAREQMVVYEILRLEKIQVVVRKTHGQRVSVGLRPGMNMGREFIDVLDIQDYS